MSAILSQNDQILHQWSTEIKEPTYNFTELPPNEDYSRQNRVPFRLFPTSFDFMLVTDTFVFRSLIFKWYFATK